MKIVSWIALALLCTVAFALAAVMMRGKKLNGPLGTVTTTGDVEDTLLRYQR